MFSKGEYLPRRERGKKKQYLALKGRKALTGQIDLCKAFQKENPRSEGGVPEKSLHCKVFLKDNKKTS